MPKKTLHISQSGFTVIEMLVILAVTAILTTIVLINYSGLNRYRELKLARNNLVSDLHRAQSYSLSSRDVVAGTQASSYGLQIDTVALPKSYRIVGYDNSVVPVQTVMTTFTMPTSTYIKSIQVTRSSGASSTATQDLILFSSPYGRVVQTYSGGAFNGTSEKDSITTVTLSTVDNTQTLPVIINGVTGNIIAQ